MVRCGSSAVPGYDILFRELSASLPKGHVVSGLWAGGLFMFCLSGIIGFRPVESDV